MFYAPNLEQPYIPPVHVQEAIGVQTTTDRLVATFDLPVCTAKHTKKHNKYEPVSVPVIIDDTIISEESVIKPDVFAVVDVPTPIVVLPKMAYTNSALDTAVTLPIAYKYNACQAVKHIAWQIGWQTKARCDMSPVDAMPLPYGTVASASAWLAVLADQMTRTSVTANIGTKTLTIRAH